MVPIFIISSQWKNMARYKFSNSKNQFCFKLVGMLIFTAVVLVLRKISLPICVLDLYIVQYIDGPVRCESRGYQAYMTSFGVCTTRKGRWVFPKSNQDCKYAVFYSQWSQNIYFRRHHINSKLNMATEQLDRIRNRYENQCADPITTFHAGSPLIITAAPILLTSVIYLLVYPEINKFTLKCIP